MLVSIWRAVLACGLLALSCLSVAAAEIPRDVRYMLEDLYGSDQRKWPKPIYQEDVNGDGIPDWIAQMPGCKGKKEDCQVELFVCKRVDGGQCLEYCYLGNGILRQLRGDAGNLKCQSTC